MAIDVLASIAFSSFRSLTAAENVFWAALRWHAAQSPTKPKHAAKSLSPVSTGQ